MLIADKQGIEPGAACRRRPLDHPARSLARIFHVRVIARQRDPDSHRVIPTLTASSCRGRERYLSWPLILARPARAQALSRSPPGARGADRPDHLVAQLDDDASAQQKRSGNLNRFAKTGTVFDRSTSAVVSVLNDADV